MLSCAAAGGKLSDALAPAAVVELYTIIPWLWMISSIMARSGVGSRQSGPKMGDSVALLLECSNREIIDDIVDECSSRDRIRRKSSRR